MLVPDIFFEKMPSSNDFHIDSEASDSENDAEEIELEILFVEICHRY